MTPTGTSQGATILDDVWGIELRGIDKESVQRTKIFCGTIRGGSSFVVGEESCKCTKRN
jgi:hypothetical protein